MKPVIAFSCNHKPTYHPDGYEVLGPHFYLYSDYVRPIAELGGAPVVIPVLLNQDYYTDSMRNVQGLILVGGGDVNPFLFGKRIERKIGPVSPDMDYGEIEMTKVALEMNIPILGICRGIQVLNLVLGGTIHQHIPADVPDATVHSTNFPPETLAHWVNIDENSMLFRILDRARIAVNSTHHQAVAKVGQDALVCGRTDDGIIEAIEMPHKKWVLGVQWHPETIWRNDEDQKKIFLSFIKACSN